MAVDAEGHEVPGAQGRIRSKGLLLRDIADFPAATFHGLSGHGHRPRVKLLQTEEDFEEAGLAAAVGAEHSEELTRLDVHVEVLPEGPLAKLEARAAKAHYRCQKESSIHGVREEMSLPACTWMNREGPAAALYILGRLRGPSVRICISLYLFRAAATLPTLSVIQAA
ncbi:hypothetical protein AHiyo1_07060 [Arthrobacter sp. Hiyo1]|nr:hypothetical protein AHiyo1_07060 [Arthrobacter sp. Hiyo1]